MVSPRCPPVVARFVLPYSVITFIHLWPINIYRLNREIFRSIRINLSIIYDNKFVFNCQYFVRKIFYLAAMLSNNVDIFCDIISFLFSVIWVYISDVVSMLACLIHICTSLSDIPLSYNKLAVLCRKS